MVGISGIHTDRRQRASGAGALSWPGAAYDFDAGVSQHLLALLCGPVPNEADVGGTGHGGVAA